MEINRAEIRREITRYTGLIEQQTQLNISDNDENILKTLIADYNLRMRRDALLGELARLDELRDISQVKGDEYKVTIPLLPVISTLNQHEFEITQANIETDFIADNVTFVTSFVPADLDLEQTIQRVFFRTTATTPHFQSFNLVIEILNYDQDSGDVELHVKIMIVRPNSDVVNYDYTWIGKDYERISVCYNLISHLQRIDGPHGRDDEAEMPIYRIIRRDSGSIPSYASGKHLYVISSHLHVDEIVRRREHKSISVDVTQLSLILPIIRTFNPVDLREVRIEDITPGIEFTINMEVSTYLAESSGSHVDMQRAIMNHADKIVGNYTGQQWNVQSNMLSEVRTQMLEEEDEEARQRGDYTTSTLVQTMAQVSDLFSSTILYRHAEARLENTVGAFELLRPVLSIPSEYVHNGRVGPITNIPANASIVTSSSGGVGQVRNIFKPIGDQTINESHFANVFSNDEYAIYLRFSYRQAPVQSETVYLQQSLPAMRIVSPSSVSTTVSTAVIGGNTIHINCPIRPHREDRLVSGGVQVPRQSTAVEIRVQEILIGYRQATTFPIDTEGRLSLELMYGLESRSAVGNTMSPVRFVTVNDGEFFGLTCPIDLTLSTVVDPSSYLSDGVILVATAFEDLRGYAWVATLGGDWPRTYNSSMRAFNVLTGGDINLSTEYGSEMTYTFKVELPIVYMFNNMTVISNNVPRVPVLGVTYASIYQDSRTELEVRRFLQTLVFRIHGNWSARIPYPPGNLPTRNTANQHQDIQQVINDSISQELGRLSDELLNMKNRLDHLERQFEMFIQSQESEWWEILLNVVMDTVLGYFSTFAGNALKSAQQAISKAVGYTRRVLMTVTKTMRNGPIFTRLLGAKNLSGQALASLETLVESVLRSINVKKSRFMSGAEPLYKNNKVAQHIDNTEKMNMMMDFSFANRNNRQNITADTLSRMHTQNAHGTSDTILPAMRVYYRPLGFLDKRVGEALHKGITRPEALKKQLRSDVANVGTRAPSHAFMTYTDVLYEDAGSYIVSKRYLGIGELNRFGRTTSDKNADIGGVNIKYRVNKITADGKYIIDRLSHTESGYTAADVDRLYRSLFGKQGDGLSTEQKWMDISRGVDAKIISADMVSEEFLSNKYTGQMIDELINSPPQFNYSLIYRNCQDFVLDVLRVAQGFSPSNKWDVSTAARMQQRRVISLMDDLMSESETFARSTRSNHALLQQIRQSYVKARKRGDLHTVKALQLRLKGFFQI
ncbi:VP3 [Bombyx mori cypovirus 1]|uniref:VP3 n=1 Tax=Bombyx mori cytoplasmic polyhedrosis virus TaxID=110829 RepID=A0A0S1LIZ2_CPVBM|nr:VP3 [Bombyx mori cypovirus 1]